MIFTETSYNFDKTCPEIYHFNNIAMRQFRIIINILFSLVLIIISASCTDQPTLPVVTTVNVSGITQTSAISGGNITSDGGDQITERGVCWAESGNPAISDNKTSDGSGKGSYTSNITGLSANTTYFVRAFAVNSAGTSYGNQQSFTTNTCDGSITFNTDLIYGSVTDIDGNIYKTITIGNQTWMAENLRVTKFNDNTSIPNITDFIEWTSLPSPGYCWYDNNEISYKSVYGALYNWNAVGTERLCPAGWHVPSHSEWTTLQTFLGGPEVAGGKLKETGTCHWQTPNVGASNESGFTALPGAQRDISNNFGDGAWIGVFGQWWTSTFEFNMHYYDWELGYGSESFLSGSLITQMGLSVRCLKDN